jgi:hypothetical protein
MAHSPKTDLNRPFDEVSDSPAPTENQMPPRAEYPTEDQPTPLYDGYPVGEDQGDGVTPDDIGALPGRLPGAPSPAQQDVPMQQDDG